MKNSKSLLLCLLILVIYSCKKDQVLHTAVPYYSYAPIDTGRWILYDVDSTFYNDFPNPSEIYHYTFQVIERIESTYLDNQGRLTHRLQRLKRESANVPWENYLTIWTSNLSSARYEKVEENIRYVKSGFPINTTNSWNGNAYNTLGKREYYYEVIHTPMMLASFKFDSTITIFEGEPANYIEEKNGREIYANHVGMIYKKFTDMKFVPGYPLHQGGVTYTYMINSYGLHSAPMPLEK